MAQDIGCSFLETSAKTATNVEEAFTLLVEYITKKQKKMVRYQESNVPTGVDMPEPSPQKPDTSQDEDSGQKQQDTIRLQPSDRDKQVLAAEEKGGCAC